MLAFIFSSPLLDMLRIILYTHEEEIMKMVKHIFKKHITEEKFCQIIHQVWNMLQ